MEENDNIQVNPPATNKRYKATKYQMECRRKYVSDRYLEGTPLYKIAEELGICYATVSADIKKVKDEWREKRVNDIDLIKLEQLAKIDRMEEAAWEEWFKSQKPSITKEVSSGSGGNGGEWSNYKKTIEGKTANTTYLHTMQWCVEQRCKIFGLYTKEDKGNAAVVVQLNWDKMGTRSEITDPVVEKIQAVTGGDNGNVSTSNSNDGNILPSINGDDRSSEGDKGPTDKGVDNEQLRGMVHSDSNTMNNVAVTAPPVVHEKILSEEQKKQLIIEQILNTNGPVNESGNK